MSQTDNLEERFRELEREVMGNKQQTNNPSNNPSYDPNKRAEPEFVAVNQAGDATKANIGSLITWVNKLTGATKVAAIIVIGLVSFTILSFVFKLVTAAISIGIMALVGFILYKVFFASSSTK